jgi:DNA-binding CsgD family transcriptional regulator
MDERLHYAIASIYATVDGATPWQAALRDLSRFADARGAMLTLEKPGSPVVDSHQYGFDADWIEAYGRDWAARSPYLSRLYEAERARNGRFLASEELLSYRDWIRTEMFNESGRYQDVHHGAAAFVDDADGFKVRLSFVRDASAGAFASDDVRILDSLVPHLRQALRLGHAFSDPLRERLRSLDAQQIPALVIDRALTLRGCNDEARALLEAGTALGLRDGHLDVAGEGRAQRLADCVREACTDRHGQRQLCLDDGPLDAPLLSLLVTRAPGRACALQAARRGDDGQQLALVTVIRRDRPRNLPGRLLRELFDLTPAESRLAQWIASGYSPDQAAGALEVRISTVRWHLKRVFAKTGVSGQTELTALLQSVAHAATD